MCYYCVGEDTYPRMRISSRMRNKTSGFSSKWSLIIYWVKRRETLLKMFVY